MLAVLLGRDIIAYRKKKELDFLQGGKRNPRISRGLKAVDDDQDDEDRNRKIIDKGSRKQGSEEITENLLNNGND